MGEKLEKIDKLLKDERLPNDVRKSLEQKKEILTNNKIVEK